MSEQAPLVLPQIYSPEHYWRKSLHYALALRTLFGVRVDTLTRQRWAELISFARTIDTYLDSGSTDEFQVRSKEVISILREPPGNLRERFPRIMPDELGKDEYNKRVVEPGLKIIELNADIKSTHSVNSYAFLRRAEGRVYADMISSIATPAVIAQPGYSYFQHWLRPVGEVTNLINSFNDIYEDYARGEISLMPSRITRIQLLGHIALALVRPDSKV